MGCIIDGKLSYTRFVDYLYGPASAVPAATAPLREGQREVATIRDQTDEHDYVAESLLAQLFVIHILQAQDHGTGGSHVPQVASDAQDHDAEALEMLQRLQHAASQAQPGRVTLADLQRGLVDGVVLGTDVP